MTRHWNGYLVRTLNQLATVYHACKPRIRGTKPESPDRDTGKKMSATGRKRLKAGALGGVLIGILIAVILRR